MKSLFRLLLWFSLALLVPAIPFVLLGDGFEQRQLEWIRGGLSSAQLFGGIVLLLTIDLFLPVPSTAVSTYAGVTLPWGSAFVAAWSGLMLGNAIGFWLTRRLGRPFAERYAKPEDLNHLDQLSQKYGLMILIVTRALPLLAEACVLLIGVTKLPWTRFLLAVGLSNLVIAAVYVSIGAWFRDSPALPIAIVASAVIPLLLILPLRSRLDRVSTHEQLGEG